MSPPLLPPLLWRRRYCYISTWGLKSHRVEFDRSAPWRHTGSYGSITTSAIASSSWTPITSTTTIAVMGRAPLLRGAGQVSVDYRVRARNLLMNDTSTCTRASATRGPSPTLLSAVALGLRCGVRPRARLRPGRGGVLACACTTLLRGCFGSRPTSRPPGDTWAASNNQVRLPCTSYMVA